MTNTQLSSDEPRVKAGNQDGVPRWLTPLAFLLVFAPCLSLLMYRPAKWLLMEFAEVVHVLGLSEIAYLLIAVIAHIVSHSGRSASHRPQHAIGKVNHGRRNARRWVVNCGLAGVPVGGEIALHFAATDIHHHMEAQFPSVEVLYANHDIAKLVGQTLQVMILKVREKITEKSELEKLSAMAEIVPDRWTEMAEAQDSRIVPLTEQELWKVIQSAGSPALDDTRWSGLLDEWSKATGNELLAPQSRAHVIRELTSNFSFAWREALKHDYEHGGRGYAAMQLDMFGELLRRTSDGANITFSEVRTALAKLDDLPQAIMDLQTHVRLQQDEYSQFVSVRFDKIKADLASIKVSLARMEDKIDILLSRTEPQATADGVVAPVLDAELAAAIREWIAKGNPLEKAVAEVANASSNFKSDRWKDADAAIAQCKVWKTSKLDWTENEEFYFLIIMGDRQLYDSDPDGAASMYEQARTKRPYDWTAQFRLATALIDQRRGDIAKARGEARRILEGLLQPEDLQEPRYAALLNNLAQLYRSQRQNGMAEPLYKRALAISKKSLGPEHPIVAGVMNNLAGLYRSQAQYTLAEPHVKCALAIYEKVLSPDHPNVAGVLDNLAGLYRNQGHYTLAEPLYKRALAINEKSLGPEHPNVAGVLNNLAGLYRDQGQYALAELHVKRALAIREKSLGPEHPDVAKVLDNLAGLYHDQGQYTLAEPLYKRALAINEKSLGPEHPDVAASLNNLAGLYFSQGQYTLPEPLYKRALAINEKSLGPEHPDVAGVLNNLALLYRIQGQYALAEPHVKRALAICEGTLGPEHPKVASVLNNLAGLYLAQAKYALAQPVLERALAIYEKFLGPGHPAMADSLNSLAQIYRAQGHYTLAEPLYKRALAISEKSLGPEHPNVAGVLDNLAGDYRAQGHYELAEPLYKRALAIREKSLGPEHSDAAVSLNNLALLYLNQGQYTLAEPLYKRALAINEKSLGLEHPDVAKVLENMALLYAKTGDKTQRQACEDRAKKIRVIKQ